MTEFTFRLKGSWTGSWNGNGHIKTGKLKQVVSVDPSMGGSGIGTNPDELLLGALGSCYMITLGIRLDKEKITYDHISLQSEGIVTKQGGLHFDRVLHRPVIFLPEEPTDEQRAELLFCIRQAERDCMIAKAVRGNVHIDVQPLFKTVAAAEA